jgi:sulfur-carrier protein
VERRIATPGTTVGEVLRALEQGRPALHRWILDERGEIREHINVYVNGTKADGETVVGDDDRIRVLPAITGG